ncbi:MAG: MerR family transcriptional regulator [Gammaproteobacteria bacterium]|nr:MerR family transcriptional regulator [Gammaproteobacteria bacterium]
MNEPTQFTLTELSALVELPVRTVRYYIQTGLIAKPGGQGRGAHYNREHLNQLLEIKKWQKAGLSLERIKTLLQEGRDGVPVPPPMPKNRGDISVCSHIYLGDGIELVIDPQRADLTPELVRALTAGTIQLLNHLKEHDHD